MVIKFGRTGQFLGCSRYPDCKATRPIGRRGEAEAVETEHKCPKCDRTLLRRENKRGPVPRLLGLPRVQGDLQHRRAGQPGPGRHRDRARLPQMRQADGVAPRARGPFLGCTGYPEVPQHDARSTSTGNPIKTPEIDVKCEKCGGPMGVKQGRRGAFLGCLAYPEVPEHGARSPKN